MFDKTRLTPDAQLYFDSMPALLQETLTQASVDLTTREDLENYVNHMYGGA